MNGEAGFGEGVVGAGLPAMPAPRSVRLIAVMPSRASLLPQGGSGAPWERLVSAALLQ